MNLIEMLVVLAAVNSSVPLDAGPHTQVTESQVVREGLVHCACMRTDEFDTRFVTLNSTRPEPTVAQACGVRKGLAPHRVKQGRGKALVVYGGR